MTSSREEAIRGSGGLLFGRAWRPSTPPRAIRAICHGFKSHGGYDAWVGEQACSADRALKLYAGRFHDLFNDIGEEVVMADVLASIEARIS